MNDSKEPNADHAVHQLISQRWSPYVFDDRPVAGEDILSVFEAARWAASSYNEQPWRFIVANKENASEFERLLSCLVDTNQIWAKQAAVLALGIVSLSFARNGKPNKTAPHDLGLAAGNLTLEATARGISVHQMAGILPERARELYGIPDGFEALTAIAIGYVGSSEDELGQRDRTPRRRRPLEEFVFSGSFGTPLTGRTASSD